MNKGIAITLIILLSLITVFVTGVFILLLNGNTKFNIFSIFNMGYSENLIDSKEIENIEDIYITTDIGDIFIEENPEDKIKVELYSEDSENYFIKEEDNQLQIKLNAKKKSFNFGGKRNRVIVKVPKNYAKTIKVRTTTGDIEVESFADMKLNVEGTTGDIKIDKADRLDFKLTTGDVKVGTLNYISGDVKTGDIKVSETEVFSAATTTGDITIDNVTKRIYARTTTGDIKIDKANIEEDSTIKTGTGDIKIESLKGAYIEASAQTGDVKVQNNDRHLEKTIKITSNTGDIKVNQ